VIISSKDLLRYLPSIIFPVDIFPATENQVLFQATREQLRAMIASKAVIGIGSRNRIKRLRVNRLDPPTAEQEAQAAKTELRRAFRESTYSRFDLKYTYCEQIENKPYTVKLIVEGGRHERWPDNAGFSPHRFNPDRIPAPLISHECFLKYGNRESTEAESAA
jgi:hypothetical protein